MQLRATQTDRQTERERKTSRTRAVVYTSYDKGNSIT